jgi:hypothetical protein
VQEVVVDGVVVVEVMVLLTMAPIEEATPTTETELPPLPMLSFPLTGNVASNWAICAKVSCCVYIFFVIKRKRID